MEVYDSALIWREQGLTRSPASLLVCPTLTSSIPLSRCLVWSQFPPYISPCCCLHSASLPSLGIYSVSCKTMNKRNFFLWPMQVSLHSGHPFPILPVSPSLEAGSLIVLGKRRVYSCLILFFNTVNLAFFS